jgi:gamma-glutamylcyclotransferase (GGCT)/AIG2-like uncharacterized protein YtfP
MGPLLDEATKVYPMPRPGKGAGNRTSEFSGLRVVPNIYIETETIGKPLPFLHGYDPVRGETTDMLVAVYGTLKSGGENYARFLPGKAPEFRGFVQIPYRMYANDAYPMLVREGASHRIFVEVFEVSEDELGELDALEEPYGYWRDTVHIAEYGSDVEIYVHAAPPPVGFDPVPSGDWR